MHKKKCIIIAKNSETIWLFLMPFVDVLSKLGYNIKIFAGPGHHDHDMLVNNLTSEYVLYNVSINPFKLWKIFIRTRKLLLEEKPQLVICNDPFASFIGRLAAGSCRINTIIYFCHGLPFAPHSNLFVKIAYYSLEWVTGFFTKAIITMNAYDYKIARNFCQNVYKINGVGVDIGKYKLINGNRKKYLRKHYGFSDNSIIIVFVGRLVPKKGVIYFLRSAKRLINKKYDLLFLIVGDGLLKNKINEFIEINSLGENIKTLGYINNTNHIIGLSDILVLPSNYIEGLPRVILESMASGVPVIATNIRGCNDLIDDRHDGILIPKSNSRYIESAIIGLLDNDKIYENIKLNAFMKVTKYYNTSIVIKQFEEIMNDILTKTER